MYENDNKDLLVEILKHATTKAQRDGFSIDFNKSFAFVACPDWNIILIDKHNVNVFDNNMIKVLDASNKPISIPHYDARLSRMPSKILYIDRQDEYDCLIPRDVYHTIVEKMCVSGAHIEVYNPKREELFPLVNKFKDEFDKKLHNYMVEFNLSLGEVYRSQFYNNILAEYKKNVAQYIPYIRDKVNVDIVPAHVTSVDALHIWLDLTEV